METSLMIIKSFFESKATSFIEDREDNYLLEVSAIARRLNGWAAQDPATFKDK